MTTPTLWLRRATPFLLTGLLVLGFGVRLRHYLAAPSYWYDEAFVLVNVFDKSFTELAGPLRCEQAAPPLFLWSQRAIYVTAGGSEWAMRAPAFLASTLAVLAMVPLARRLTGGWLWAVGFAAVSQPAVFHTVCVKPYAGDLLATVLIYLAGARLLAGTGRGRWLMALVVAAVMPWYSYPSIFALGGLSLALGIEAIRQRSWRFAPVGALFSLVWAGSFAAAWLMVGRNQQTHHLAAYWGHGFLDLSSFSSALKWIVHCLYKLGDYGTTGMGVPLLLLGAVGAAALGRRSPALLAMFLGQWALAIGASAARLYPLDDRLTFFAVPTVWLLATVGVDTILGLRVAVSPKWAVAGLLALPLLPGVVRYGYWMAVVPAKCDFRPAFEYVQRRAAHDDLVWVSQPEVYEVYFGKDRSRLLGADGEPGRRRVWAVTTPGTDVDSLLDRGLELQARKSFKTIEVTLLAAPAQVALGR
jgi:4-amino-4-deoxy-L-arabinose transferase-like glycosyltransferase